MRVNGAQFQENCDGCNGSLYAFKYGKQIQLVGYRSFRTMKSNRQFLNVSLFIRVVSPPLFLRLLLLFAFPFRLFLAARLEDVHRTDPALEDRNDDLCEENVENDQNTEIDQNAGGGGDEASEVRDRVHPRHRVEEPEECYLK